MPRHTDHDDTPSLDTSFHDHEMNVGDRPTGTRARPVFVIWCSTHRPGATPTIGPSTGRYSHPDGTPRRYWSRGKAAKIAHALDAINNDNEGDGVFRYEVERDYARKPKA